MTYPYLLIKPNTRPDMWFVFWQGNCVYETVVPPLDERDFEKTVTPIVQEYFEHGDTNEVAVSTANTMQEMACE